MGNISEKLPKIPVKSSKEIVPILDLLIMITLFAVKLYLW